jgi:hypothetical protein
MDRPSASVLGGRSCMTAALACPDEASFITGVALPIDGGLLI